MIFAKPRKSSVHQADAELAAKIHAILCNYAPLRATNPPIKVDVTAGAATLHGVVRSVALRNAASRLAATVPGVQAVRNELLDDPGIVLGVAQALATHAHIRLLTDVVDIKSYHGEVTLSGQVSCQAQQLAAEAVTRSVPGVIDVINRLVVIPDGNRHPR